MNIFFRQFVYISLRLFQKHELNPMNTNIVRMIVCKNTFGHWSVIEFLSLTFLKSCQTQPLLFFMMTWREKLPKSLLCSILCFSMYNLCWNNNGNVMYFLHLGANFYFGSVANILDHSGWSHVQFRCQKFFKKGEEENWKKNDFVFLELITVLIFSQIRDVFHNLLTLATFFVFIKLFIEIPSFFNYQLYISIKKICVIWQFTSKLSMFVSR